MGTSCKWQILCSCPTVINNMTPDLSVESSPVRSLPKPYFSSVEIKKLLSNAFSKSIITKKSSNFFSVAICIISDIDLPPSPICMSFFKIHRLLRRN